MIPLCMEKTLLEEVYVGLVLNTKHSHKLFFLNFKSTKVRIMIVIFVCCLQSPKGGIVLFGVSYVYIYIYIYVYIIVLIFLTLGLQLCLFYNVHIYPGRSKYSIRPRLKLTRSKVLAVLDIIWVEKFNPYDLENLLLLDILLFSPC